MPLFLIDPLNMPPYKQHIYDGKDDIDDFVNPVERVGVLKGLVYVGYDEDGEEVGQEGIVQGEKETEIPEEVWF